MQSILDPSFYTDQIIFEKEKKYIFEKLWLFACLTIEIDADNAYAAIEIGRKNVLIQNSKGKIRAFANECPHRLIPLFSNGFGQSALKCPYHGWTFKADGNIKSIPNENSLYQFSELDKSELALTEFKTEIIGKFIFINFNPNPISIDQQFSKDIQDRLKIISHSLSINSVHSSKKVNYNWKLQYENVLDYNHVPYIHPKSFLPLLEKSNKSSAQKTQIFSDIPTSIIEQSFFTKAAFKIPYQKWQDNIERYESEGYFENLFLFPNININCADGVIFKIERYEPISAEETEISFTMLLAKEKKRIRALPAILRGCVKNDLSVLHEDSIYLEKLQRNLKNTKNKCFHGAYERYLVSFSKVYIKLLNEEVC